MRLLCDGVLVGEHGVLGVALVVLLQPVLAAGRRLVVLVGKLLEGFGVGGVNSRHHGEVVLEFMEVVIAGCDGVVQRVDQ